MNQFIKQLQKRASVRAFSNQQVEREKLNLLFDTMMQTATSHFFQQASVIHISDIDKKKKISEVCGQPFIANASELLIFIADSNRNMQLCMENNINIEERVSDVDIFFQGIVDASLMASNAANIIDSLEMGSVFLGSILNDAQKIIEILKLPKYTFPVVGLAFGYPLNETSIKPKMDKKYRVFENSYPEIANYQKYLEDYNDITVDYYQKRGLATNFYEHINKYYISNDKTTNRVELLNFARKNGYKL